MKRSGASRYLLVALLLLLAGVFVHRYGELSVPLNRPLAEFPRAIGGWKMLSEEHFDAPTLDVLRPTDYLSRTYIDKDNSRVRLYIGYHGGGEGSGEIHSPRNCLPGSGWYEVSSTPTQLKSGVKALTVVQAIYQKGEQRELFFYWFQVQDRVIGNEYFLKMAQVASSLWSRRRDAAFIRISVPGGEEDEALALTIAQQFTRDAYPLIGEFLPK